MFDNALKLFGSYWSGHNCDGFPIHPVAIPCLADEEPYTYAEKEALDAFMKKSCREISSNALDHKLVQELQFLRVHMVRGLNYLQLQSVPSQPVAIALQDRW